METKQWYTNYTAKWNTPSTYSRIFSVFIFSGNLYGKLYWATLPALLLDHLWVTYNRRHPNSSTNNWNSSSRSDQWIPESKAMDLNVISILESLIFLSLLGIPRFCFLLAFPSSVLNAVYSVCRFSFWSLPHSSQGFKNYSFLEWFSDLTSAFLLQFHTSSWLFGITTDKVPFIAQFFMYKNSLPPFLLLKSSSVH